MLLRLKRLAEEIEDFYRFIRPSAHEQMVRERVISRVRTLIIERWPDAEVDVFGSFYTGLYLPTSDIDIVSAGITWHDLDYGQKIRTKKIVLGRKK